MNNNLITIIIPVFNSEKTIFDLVSNIFDSLKLDYKFEVILINDCSSDNSDIECLKLYDKYKGKIKYYKLAKNVGEHNAVMAGLNYAMGDWIVIMDDDFQNPVSEVEKIINFSLSNDYDVVYTHYQYKKHNIFRNLGSYFNNKVANIMLKKPNDLYLSSFKSIQSKVVKEIIKYKLPYPYIDGLILRTTRNISSIQVKHKKRIQGKSGYTLKKLFSLWLNMFTNFSVVPLRISTLFGFIFSFVGLIFGIITIIEKLLYPELPQGYPTIIIVVLLFSGMQLIFLGVIGEYLGRLFLSNNKHPQYFIDKRWE
ncbi:MAG: glycosyltransferase [Candidatus Marinimicrobia bacterium]|nr:glycosyltransferase [Candidatus Neomarinimicrobiota bacterium]